MCSFYSVGVPATFSTCGMAGSCSYFTLLAHAPTYSSLSLSLTHTHTHNSNTLQQMGTSTWQSPPNPRKAIQTGCTTEPTKLDSPLLKQLSLTQLLGGHLNLKYQVPCRWVWCLTSLMWNMFQGFVPHLAGGWKDRKNKHRLRGKLSHRDDALHTGFTSSTTVSKEE